uniref:ABC transmembrane type-1 domain-containing protein n=1 Tax=Panagrolaimus superbus TaxID=310955 RepID=A0A914ZBL4_9BILA
MGKGVKVVDDNSKISVPLLKNNEPEPEVVEEKPKKVSIRQLWRYAQGPDLIMVFIGILVSTITGVGMPLMSIVVGDLSDSFIKMTTHQEHPNDTCVTSANETWSECYTDDMFKKAVLTNVYYYLILGFAVLIAAFTQVTCFLVSGENMIHRMRKAFFKSIMRQDISWFDKNNSGTLTTKLFDNLERVKEGTGDKMGLLIQFLAQFFGGFIIAFSYDWKLTLIMMSLSPLLVCCGLFMAKLMASSAAKEAKQYAAAGAIAEQALTSIRTVVAFNGEKHECDRYDSALVEGKNTGVLKSVYIGVGLASTFVVMFSSYCLAFWIGTNFIANGTMEPKTVLTVFFSVMMGSMALGQAGQQFAVLGIAQGAASAIFEIIDRDPEIDPYSNKGVKPDNIQGHIVIENIEFSYPTRKDVKILEGISFDALPGQTVALVGSSGCGKSTIVQLLLRYYNPDNGKIIIDGHELSEINIHFLRNMIGVVSQEPILFNCSIEENIQYGNDD